MSARIVVVEDDIISQDIVKSALQAKGFIVDVASDGFSAVQLLNKGGYDLALIDYQLPDMETATPRRGCCATWRRPAARN
jgi:DNA-binding response OmpR family regulator